MKSGWNLGMPLTTPKKIYSRPELSSAGHVARRGVTLPFAARRLSSSRGRPGKSYRARAGKNSRGSMTASNFKTLSCRPAFQYFLLQHYLHCLTAQCWFEDLVKKGVEGQESGEDGTAILGVSGVGLISACGPTSMSPGSRQQSNTYFQD